MATGVSHAAFLNQVGTPPPTWQAALLAWSALALRTGSTTVPTAGNAIVNALTQILPETTVGTACVSSGNTWTATAVCGIDFTRSPGNAAALTRAMSTITPCVATCCPAGNAAFPFNKVSGACAASLAFPAEIHSGWDAAASVSWCPEAEGFAWTSWVAWLTASTTNPVTCTFDPCRTTIPDPTGSSVGAAFQCAGTGPDATAAPSFQATLNAVGLIQNALCACAGAGAGGASCGGHGECRGSGYALTSAGACQPADVSSFKVAVFSDAAHGVGTVSCSKHCDPGYSGVDCTESGVCPEGCTTNGGVCAGTTCICRAGYAGAGCNTPICATTSGGICDGQETGGSCVNGVCACLPHRCGVDCSTACGSAVGALDVGGPSIVQPAPRHLPAASFDSRTGLYDTLAGVLAVGATLLIALLIVRAVRAARDTPTAQSASLESRIAREATPRG